MDLRQLRYFYTICEEGQITAAAKKLHMAQPPLSQALQALEKELGVSLMQRGTRSIVLSEAGEVLKVRAQQILELCEGTKKEVIQHGTQLHKTLHIGMVSSAHNVFLQTGLHAFHEAYPHVQFRIKEGNTFQVMDMLQKGLIDFGVVRTPFVRQDAKTLTLRKEGMVAAFPKHFSIPQGKLTLLKLKVYPVIYYERYAVHIEQLCMEYGFYPNCVCQNQDARTTLLWVNAGIGVGIVPKSACDQVNVQDLQIVDIAEERLESEIMLVHYKDEHAHDVNTKFLSFFKSYEEKTYGNVGYL